ncbi:hypothetical protein CLV30_13154 [Haloactinopolyspora alba]|uniref:Uncharacterized protein n=1 Tax=Haloactinopolyspora alba TaxID=648780 RepID=A0A2P8D747_9ACTN|nr:hypothetical protein [Haloactinopolyspora alba]PSK93027.1 hypothetical protein CLV30_13154 [Haloactinopolyspora alba]
MPDSTPIYGLPYPLKTDPPDVAGMSVDLATAIEDELARQDGDVTTLRTDVAAAVTNADTSLDRAPVYRGIAAEHKTIEPTGPTSPGTLSSRYGGNRFTVDGFSWNRAVPLDGYYRVNAVARFDNARAVGSVNVTIRLNVTDPTDGSGGNLGAISARYTTFSGGRPFTIRSRVIAPLNAGGTVMFTVAQNTGRNLRLVKAYTFMEIEYLRPL